MLKSCLNFVNGFFWFVPACQTVRGLVSGYVDAVLYVEEDQPIERAGSCAAARNPICLFGIKAKILL